MAMVDVDRRGHTGIGGGYFGDLGADSEMASAGSAADFGEYSGDLNGIVAPDAATMGRDATAIDENFYTDRNCTIGLRVGVAYRVCT